MKTNRRGGSGQDFLRSDIDTALARLGSAPTHASRPADAPALVAEREDDAIAEGVPPPPVHHVRINDSFLAKNERKALIALARRTPAAVTPDHLTVLGLIGAFLVLVGFAACRISPWFVSVAILGLLLNWLGDSLDGTLARYRKTERPDYGYFLDHSCDLVSQTFIFVGLGLSPYFTLFSALLALSMYLLMTSFTYLKVLILKTHHLSYYGMGATELRLLLIGWALFALWFGPALTGTRYDGVAILDITISVLWSLVFIAFAGKVWSDARRFRDTLDR